jgi:hypothetical protein
MWLPNARAVDNLDTPVLKTLPLLSAEALLQKSAKLSSSTWRNVPAAVNWYPERSEADKQSYTPENVPHKCIADDSA